MAKNLKKDIKKEVDLNYLNKDFKSFQEDLRNFARAHYSDNIKDFSESGLGGLFVDMGAYIGDVLSFYLDHQFSELDIRTAMEANNIERIARNSGVKLSGASPAVVEVEFYCKIPAKTVNGLFVPDPLYLFKILEGTKLTTVNGKIFELVENINFGEKDNLGQLLLDYRTGNTDSNGTPINFICLKKGVCISSSTYQESFDIESTLVPFRTIVLSKANVNEIISVKDLDLNDYYEVDNLSQDTVFKSVETSVRNSNSQSRANLEVIAAPRRFVKEYSRSTGKTTLFFGAGSSDTYEEDVIPNPSDHALKLFGDRKVFNKIAIDPNSLLSTNTLGTAPVNTTLTVKYRAGGGATFNVKPSTIRQVSTLLTEFDQSGLPSVIRGIRNSVEVDNELGATGGTDKLSLEALRVVAIAGSTAQSRIVSKQDLIARVYTMPGQFGRFFRAGVRPDPRNPNASVISGICIDDSSRLTYANDQLKINLATYLDEFRIIGDAIEILDAPIVNITIKFEISVLSSHNKQNTVSNVLQKIKNYLKIENMQIDAPLNISAIESLIQLTDGVNSVVFLEIGNITGVKNNLNYIGEIYSINENITDKMLYPPVGGIFEVRYPNRDIKGSSA